MSYTAGFSDRLLRKSQTGMKCLKQKPGKDDYVWTDHRHQLQPGQHFKNRGSSHTIQPVSIWS